MDKLKDSEIELKNGFLDYDLNVEVNRRRQESKDAYKVAEEFNLLMYEIEKNFKKEEATNRDLYVFTVFNQIHISSQTYILLIERGLYCDAQIILRAIYEKILNLKIVIEDEEYLNRILKDTLCQSFSTLKKIKENQIFELIPENVVDKRMDEYKNAIEKMDSIKLPMNLSDVADKVDMKRQYIYYKLLNEYTHNDLGALMQQLIFKEEGIIINGNQIEQKMSDEILRFIECSEYVIRAISQYMKNFEHINKMENIQLRYEYLWK